MAAAPLCKPHVRRRYVWRLICRTSPLQGSAWRHFSRRGGVCRGGGFYFLIFFFFFFFFFPLPSSPSKYWLFLWLLYVWFLSLFQFLFSSGKKKALGVANVSAFWQNQKKNKKFHVLQRSIRTGVKIPIDRLLIGCHHHGGGEEFSN